MMISSKVRLRHALVVALMALEIALISQAGPSLNDAPTIRPRAVVETEPIASEGDAADDPAIWVHPVDSRLSLVLGTDKKGGLNVFDLEGKRLQVVTDGSRPNNVDVLYGFPMGDQVVDLAIAGTRIEGKFGVAVWRIDPEKRQLTELGPVPAFAVFDGGEPYGSCVYRSPRDQSFYFFVSNKAGDVEQYRLEADGEKLRATRVRQIKVGSQVEGCVADFDRGVLYLAEEELGIWKYGAEPDAGSVRTLVARVGENGLTADVEGLTLYYGTGSTGYLIASSQGNDSFKVFDRADSNAFVATIDPQPGLLSDVGETDGIDVSNVSLSSRFPKGLLVVQDGKPKAGRQNFKFFAWEDIAGDQLKIDTTRPVRDR